MFAEQLKKLRKSKKLTQKQLANLLNISPSTIAMYEVKRREPDHKTLNQIANFFNVTVDYLLGRTNSETTINLDENKTKMIESIKILSDEEADDLRRLAERLFPDKFKGVSNKKNK